MALSAQIIFPPQFEPFQPYLAGPYLKGLLKTHGVAATCFDANIHFYDWLLSQPKAFGGEDDNSAYLRSNAQPAIHALKRRPSSIGDYRWATNIVDELLQIKSPPRVRLGLTYLKVGNRYASEDLKAYLASSGNLFESYFEHDADDILGEQDVSVYLLTLVVIDQLAAAIAFAREIKKRRPNAKVMVGGPLISRLHQKLTSIDWIRQSFDAIAPGEAYRLLPALLDLQHAYTGHVSPDFDDCEWDRYWSCERVLPYLASHGCKWGKCTFCSHHMSYDGYRTSTAHDIVADIERLVSRHDIRCISFCDEYLTPAQLRDISSGFLKNGISASWSTFARPEPAFKNPEFLHQLHSAGCRMLMFGLESGSQRILKAMKKGTRVDNFRSILEGCKAANIAIRYDFMVGFPGETEEDVRETYEFITNNRDVVDTPFSSYSMSAFELREGIPIEQAAKQYGIRPRQLLRGDLDDQFEFECDSGLNEDGRRQWRETFIQYAKSELSSELICPHNKTHQLVLKHLYDENALELPVLQITADSLPALRARLARGVVIDPVDERGFAVRNLANGGEIILARELRPIFDLFCEEVSLPGALAAQPIWNTTAFVQFITFLYRNEYLDISRTPATPTPGKTERETAHA